MVQSCIAPSLVPAIVRLSPVLAPHDRKSSLRDYKSAASHAFALGAWQSSLRKDFADGAATPP
jgi:hypothetical protein